MSAQPIREFLGQTVPGAVFAKARAVRLLILDVDGVLTDGRLHYGWAGFERKAFHAQDGSAMEALRRAGVPLAIISGRGARAVRRRARELGVRHVWLNTPDKAVALDRLATETGIDPQAMAHVGDDLGDLPLFQRVGFAVAVADAHPLLRQRAHYVTQTPGGRGAVREVCDLLLFAQGKWPRQF